MEVACGFGGLISLATARASGGAASSGRSNAVSKLGMEMVRCGDLVFMARAAWSARQGGRHGWRGHPAAVVSRAKTIVRWKTTRLTCGLGRQHHREEGRATTWCPRIAGLACLLGHGEESWAAQKNKGGQLLGRYGRKNRAGQKRGRSKNSFSFF